MAGLCGAISLILINWVCASPSSTLSLGTPGNIGCLFSESICDSEQEVCVDDGLFGRCKQVYELLSDTPLYRFELNEEELASLTEEVEALLAQGYSWHHPRTQCILQTILASFDTGREFNKIFCDSLRDDEPSSLGDQQIQDEGNTDVSNMAYISYKPSELDPNPEFADEVYSPPGMPELEKAPEVEVEEKQDSDSGIPILFSKIYNTPDGFRTGLESKDQQSGFFSLDGDPAEERDKDNVDVKRYYGLRSLFSDDSRQYAPSDIEDLYNLNEGPAVERRSQQKSHFRKHYNSPEAFRDASHHHENSEEDNRVLEVMRRSPPPFDESIDFDPELINSSPNLNLGVVDGEDDIIPIDKGPGDIPDFIDDGTVLNSPKDVDVNQLAAETSDLSDLLDELDEWSFQRSERLDVKKPGPQFSTNNYAFQGGSTKKVEDSKKIVTKPSSQPAKEGQKETMPSELPNHPPKSKVQSRTLWFQSILGDPHKKGVKSSHFSPYSSPYASPSKNSVLDNDHYELVDTTFTYIEFKDGITTWKEGAHIVKTVANLLHLPQETFSNERMDRNEVTFKVEPNPLGLDAYEVARRIDGIKDKLKKEIGVTVTSVGVGDKNKLPTVEKLSQREEQAYVVIVMVCGVLAALGLSAGVLYLTRRHGNKLANMTSSDTEPSKHYQDLCRARMSSKNGDGSSAVPPHRVASLSRESDNSPSSRSSTSSWSEEPALSNMDVATGQLVLSYMEEHLKNKDRLESEWAALCAYSADPCETTIAEKEENKPKNRCETALPYDHARVVLNELSNITGSDYINASTITDHDPRNPAYIVTQGPLQATAPDFWQMVWEQGCVVIVMLTRLVENDNVMCHRYWPAEGSELYHIFEVHLVSEHIWCDDYLVRSFYLKNMKTGETRTVTQFHFLSWPDASVPQLTKPLLEFRRKVNKSFRGRSCPIVVHCSDGVGRSGTYCLVDMVLNRMAKGAKEIDVAATLEHIRDQRAGALATAQQFKFVISAVSDELHAILRVHPQAAQ